MSKLKASENLSNIGSVERDTGLSKDTLRIWERRYDFPRPLRDGNGDRAYPSDQVKQLILIKRLIDRGRRPRKIVGLDHAALTELLAEVTTTQAPGPDIEALLQLVMGHQLPGLRHGLAQALARQGLQRFILETIVPLNEAVGDAWMHGKIAVFEEHLYTEVAHGLLRNAITAMRAEGNAPRVLLSSLPGEQHNLGLLMLEAMLAMENAQCIALGTETPALEIVKAAHAHKVDIVALSFSAAYPAAKAADALGELRAILPDAFMLCAGGGAITRIRRPISGVNLITSLESMCELVRSWRTEPKLSARSSTSLLPFFAISGPTVEVTSSSNSLTSISSANISALPASTLDRSSTSLIKANRWVPALLIFFKSGNKSSCPRSTTSSMSISL